MAMEKISGRIVTIGFFMFILICFGKACADDIYNKGIKECEAKILELYSKRQALQVQWQRAWSAKKFNLATEITKQIDSIVNQVGKLGTKKKEYVEKISREKKDESSKNNLLITIFRWGLIRLKDSVSIGKKSNIAKYLSENIDLDKYEKIRNAWKNLVEEKGQVSKEDIIELFLSYGFEKSNVFIDMTDLTKKIGELKNSIGHLYLFSSAVRELVLDKKGILEFVNAYTDTSEDLELLNRVETSILDFDEEYKQKYLANPVYHEHFWSPYRSSDISDLKFLASKYNFSKEDINCIIKLRSIPESQKLEKVVLKLRSIIYAKMLQEEKCLYPLIENIFGADDAQIRKLAFEYSGVIHDSELDDSKKRALQKEVHDILNKTEWGNIIEDVFNVESTNAQIVKKSLDIKMLLKRRNLNHTNNDLEYYVPERKARHSGLKSGFISQDVVGLFKDVKN